MKTYFYHWRLRLFSIILILGIALLLFPQRKEIKLRENIPAKNITLAFVGDIMLDRGVRSSVYKNFNGDYSEIFSKVQNRLSVYDFLFGNLEGPVSDKGTDGGNIYSFRMEPKIVSVLKQAGFDVVSVANNHIFNWGQEAFDDTLQLLLKGGIKPAGQAYFNVEGTKIAVLAFSEFSAPGIVTISDEAIREAIFKAELDNDFIIISYHFGEEYQKLPNDYQIKYAHLAVDYGADLVIGHHPHVVQTLEKYKEAYIIYSLGNFVFDQYFSADTMSGGLLEVLVNTKTKKIEKAELKKVTLNQKFQIEDVSVNDR